ncbi:MAG: hypothetical protein ACFFED_11360 [Candidatus Thorarchaeota archaeon]
MITRQKISRDEIFILGFFILVLASVFYLMITETVWIIVQTEVMAVWIIFASVSTATLGGVVLTYSFVAHRQVPELRYLVIGLLALDMVFISLSFLFTHPASELWIPQLADRQRNRSIIIAFGLALIPSVLFGAFKGEVPILGEKLWINSLWSGVVIPLVVLWFTFNPEPVIVSTDTSDAGGIFNATPIGLIIILAVMSAFLLSFARYSIEWLRSRNRITLGSSLSLFLWILALILLGILDDPFLILEIVWYGLVGCGFLIIATTMIITSILEPHKALNELVEERTKKLESSEMESSMYLDLWSHKIGNILQGMMTYIEIISEIARNEGITEPIEKAKDLGKEANLINRQVNNLAAIKQTLDQPLRKVNVREALESISPYNLERETAFHLSNDVDPEFEIIADELLIQLFYSLFVYAIKRTTHEQLTMDVQSLIEDHERQVVIHCSDRSILPDVTSYLSNRMDTTSKHFGLELFTMKLLLHRYDAKSRYIESVDDNSGNLVLSFKM